MDEKRLEERLESSYWVLSGKVRVVGDDFFINKHWLPLRGIKEGCANSILIKVANRVLLLKHSTLEWRKKLVTLPLYHTVQASWRFSHRWHIAVATMQGQIKTGSLSRTNRIASYKTIASYRRSNSEVAEYRGFRILYSYEIIHING